MELFNRTTLCFICIFHNDTYFFMCWENVDVQSISRRLFFRALLFDNKLKEITSEFVPIESRLFNNYCEFNRGNYSRSITEGYTGRYQGNTYAFDYIFYHFHYVDKRTERITDSEGRSTFQTFHYHYDRYGIELDFRLVRLLAITSKSIYGFDGKRYKTSSNRFNRHFRVITGDEMTAARFLKPAVVLVCEEITNKFRELNLEFNKQGGLIMSFDNKKVLTKQGNSILTIQMSLSMKFQRIIHFLNYMPHWNLSIH
ncbi:DUF3137 domain-containing protein [Escherichia coli]|uniref:DUF3137 domain-containing protein n=2 Tax=Escherichia coli TaxID=562 RepID=UPI0035CFC270